MQSKICIAVQVILAALTLYEVNSAVLELPAIGRFARLGELYNGTANNFTGETIFRRFIPPELELIRSTDIPLSEVTYTVYDSLEDKTDFIGIGAEFAIEVKVGSVEVGVKGEGAFIKDEKSSRKFAEGVFCHKSLTKKQSIQVTDEQVRPYVSTDTLRETDATHVVTGIFYGANVYVKFTDTNTENRDMQEVSGNLEVQLKIAQTVSGSAWGDLNVTESEINRTYNFSMQIFGDLIIDKIPGNALDVQDLIQRIPELLGRVNGGLGKPIRYVLTPISELRTAFEMEDTVDRLVYSLDEDKLNQIMTTLDEITVTRQILGDVATSFDNHREVVPTADRQRVQNLSMSFEYAALQFQAKVRTALVMVRTDGNQSLLTSTYSDYFLEEFSARNVRRMLEWEFEATERKIPFYNNFVFNRTFDYLGRSNSLGPYLINSQRGIVYIVYFNISLIEASGSIWEQNRELFTYIDKPWSSIAILDCDFWPGECKNVNRTTIHGYFKGRRGTIDARVDMSIRDESTKTLPAVGRKNVIGDLYDATTGLFTGESIFLNRDERHSHYIGEDPLESWGTCNSIESVGWDGIMKQLQAPAEMGQLLYREKLLNLEGSGEIFHKEFNPPNETTSVIICLNKTFSEIVTTTPSEGLFEILDMATISRTSATHFVESIEYGASSFLTFHHEDPSLAKAEADLWKDIVEAFLIDNAKQDLPNEIQSNLKLFSDISPFQSHQLTQSQLKKFLQGAGKSHLNSLPVIFALKPVTLLKHDFAVASSTKVVHPEDEVYKRVLVSQCSHTESPVTCIDRRFSFYDQAKHNGVQYIRNEDQFQEVRDTAPEQFSLLLFKWRWIDTDTQAWVENSEKFFDVVNGSKYVSDCMLFDKETKPRDIAKICQSLKTPAVYLYNNSKIVSFDLLTEYRSVYGNDGLIIYADEILDDVDVEEFKAEENEMGIWDEKLSYAEERAQSLLNVTERLDRELREMRVGFDFCFRQSLHSSSHPWM